MADRGYTEQFVDYSGGREGAPTLTVMVGISGSGKSVLTRDWVLKGYGRVLRFNRDNLRAMMYPGVTWENGGKRNEDLVRRYEQEGVKAALRASHVTEVIVDDTNCVLRTRYGWEEIARDTRSKFRLVLMTTSLADCIERDSKRTGIECVGEKVVRGQYKTLCEATVTPKMYDVLNLNRAILDRQALRAGELQLRLPDAPIVLFDIDGTVSDSNGVRSPYDESKVLLDNRHEAVIAEIQSLYATHNVFAISGRTDGCAEDTVIWMTEGTPTIPFDHIFMRATGDRRKDSVVKKEILDELAAVVSKSRIVKVFDDRKAVIEMWKENRLNVQVVANNCLIDNPYWEHKDTCQFVKTAKRGYRRCLECGALESF